MQRIVEAPDPQARQAMRGNRSKDTAPELKLRQALRAAGLVGYRIHRASLPGKPDIAFGRAKLAIFVHGCFWHGCPTCTRNLTPKRNHAYWSAKIQRNQARHALVESQLAAIGFDVVVVWECELKRDLNAIVRAIGERVLVSKEAGAYEMDSP